MNGSKTPSSVLCEYALTVVDKELFAFFILRTLRTSKLIVKNLNRITNLQLIGQEQTRAKFENHGFVHKILSFTSKYFLKFMLFNPHEYRSQRHYRPAK